jgi:hypothetical protein
MTIYIQSIDYDLWTIIEKGYDVPESAPLSENEMKKHQLNIKAMQLLQGALDDRVFDKMMDLKTAKDNWDKLKQRYEGTSKSKELKLESLTEQLHQIKMRTDEDIRSYLDRMESLVSKLRSLGKMDDVTDAWLAKRVLRTVTSQYEPKVFVLEEYEDTPTSEQVFDTLYHFESKLNQEDEPSTKEAAFKTISKHEEASTSKQKGKTHSCSNPEDEEPQNFLAQNLPRGSSK